jgi:hypothetical protein
MSEPATTDVAAVAAGRETWDVPVPPGGWGSPWPQCVELARALPSSQWTLVGGLMVQLHAAAAGLAVSRPTADVDIILHIETGAATTAAVIGVLTDLGYTLETSIAHDAPAHRFVRGEQQIDVMIADHAAPSRVPTIGGRKPFKVAGGTQALQRTVNCRMTVDGDGPVLISIPNTLGALVLKGAAYLEDSRDKDRHLDDAVVLCATINPTSNRGTDEGQRQVPDPGPAQGACRHRSPVLAASGPRRPDTGMGCAPDPGRQPQRLPAHQPPQRLTLPLRRRRAAGVLAAAPAVAGGGRVTAQPHTEEHETPSAPHPVRPFLHFRACRPDRRAARGTLPVRAAVPP